MWASLLPELAGAAGEIAARHPVEPVVAARVAADVRARAWLDGRLPGIDDVAASTRARSAGALPAGVTLARPAAGWDQLVLAADRLAQLRAAVARLRHQALVLDDWGFLRGRPGARGVRMLLSGPPGTGKTLSAEVLARELGVDLMVVDISRVLSKWIGETEQRLAEVFDAAEPGQAVLLFDEADALFGRRTEIADAHDRYANLETAYLLQRLDRFEGLAILTTNLRQNIDEAFTRRIEFVVEYGEPTRSEREALWRAHVPPGAPLAPDLDFAELAARYPVVGGLIRNAAVAAAFLAAGDGTPITRDHALRALEREYEKHGRAFPGRPPQPPGDLGLTTARPIDPGPTTDPEPHPDQRAARGTAQRSPR
jgi:SpoVK/Ycf46/Vps4 family AAA+-type ATPase